MKSFHEKNNQHFSKICFWLFIGLFSTVDLSAQTSHVLNLGPNAGGTLTMMTTGTFTTSLVRGYVPSPPGDYSLIGNTLTEVIQLSLGPNDTLTFTWQNNGQSYPIINSVSTGWVFVTYKDGNYDPIRWNGPDNSSQTLWCDAIHPTTTDQVPFYPYESLQNVAHFGIGASEGYLAALNKESDYSGQCVIVINNKPPTLSASVSGTWQGSTGSISNITLGGSPNTLSGTYTSVSKSTGQTVATGTFSGSNLLYSALPSGDQNVTLTVTSNGTPVSTTVEVLADKDPPAFPAGSVLMASLSGGSGTYSQINVGWLGAADSLSGLAGYLLTVGTKVYPLQPTVTSNTINLSDLSLDRSKDNTVVLDLAAVDTVGNSTDTSKTSLSVTMVIPKIIQITNGANAVLNADQTTTVSLPLNVTAAEFFANYSEFRLVPAGAGLPSSLTSSMVIIPSSVVDSSGNILDKTHWTTYKGSDGNSYLEYLYSIPAIAGVGGKSLQFSTFEVAANATNEESCGMSPSSPIILPSHPGKLTTLQILDMTNNLYGSSGFKVDSTGRVQVDFQGTGLDQDNWSVEIDRVTVLAAGGTNLTSYAKLGGAASVSYPYNATTSSYAEQKVPITLAIGTNNIQVLWTQGADRNNTVHYSQFVTMDYEKTASGYTLNVSVGNSATVQTNASGAVLVSPGEPVNLSLSGVDPSTVSWDFGDGTSQNPDVVSNTLSVSHPYTQSLGQTTDSVTYTLNLTVAGNTTSIPILVQDTQDGTLYVNEIWNGPHTVTGNVIVPSGMSLTIGSIASASTMVTFQGGLASGTNQGMTVLGTLTVSPTGVGFASGSSIWGTILVSGKATINGSSIQGADRGITAGPGSTVAVSNTSFLNNNIGLQVYGVSSTVVTNCSFIGNSGYGVKEDAGGRPVLIQNSFDGNTFDYYAFGARSDVQAGSLVGVLSMSELNLLPNGTQTPNSGNTSTAAGN